MQATKAHYRKEIDGLRALAVLAVILNHMHRNFLPGGYLGVDVFFVISGFVITGSLSGLPTESFTAFFARFFERRIKRLLPALALCVLATSFLMFYVDPAPTTSVLTGVFSLFGFSNIYLFANSSDYFARAAEANAFTQTWSLGVEEQFYLVFPLLAWGAGYLKGNAGSRKLIWIISALSLMSLAAFILLGSTHPHAAFYLMPARLWELGAGCLLYASFHALDLRYFAAYRNALSVLALVALAALMFVPPAFSTWATIAVVATTLLLLGASGPGTLAYRFLNVSLLQYLGKISYSLYLWHWTVLCFSRWLIGSHVAVLPILALLMILLASCSYHLVERPLRSMQWANRSGRTAMVGFFASICTVGILFASLSSHASFLRQPTREIVGAPAFLPVKNVNTPYDPTCVVDGEKRLLGPKTMDDCTVLPKRPGVPTIWAMGDSHAGHLQALLYSVHDRTGAGVHLIETPGIAYPLNVAGFAPREKIFDEIMRRAKPGDIILVSRIYLDRISHEPLGGLEEWSQRLGQLAHRLESRGLKLVVFGPPPIFSYEDVRACYFSTFGISPCMEDRGALLKQVGKARKMLEDGLAGTRNAFIFDTFELFCPASELMCSPIANNKFMYRDKDHFNTYGAATLSLPFIKFLESSKLITSEDAWFGTYQAVEMKHGDLPGVTLGHMSGAESWGRWTDGTPVSFAFDSWIPRQFRLSLLINECFGPVIGQTISVKVGDQEQGFACPAKQTSVTLDFRNVATGVDTITIGIPNPVSPRELANIDDGRKLGLALVRLDILPLQ
jgi:peptidoglycan/LPS O-acetylase OafA/YrhL